MTNILFYFGFNAVRDKGSILTGMKGGVAVVHTSFNFGVSLALDIL